MFLLGDGCLGLLLGYFFIAGWVKLVFIGDTRQTLVDRVLRTRRRRLRTAAIAAFELALGLALLISQLRSIALLTLVAFVTLGAFLLMRAYTHTDFDTPCGCNGGSTRPFRPVSLWRNALLGVCAIVAYLLRSPSSLTLERAPYVGFGVATAIILHLSSWIVRPGSRVDPNLAMATQCADWRPSRATLERQLWHSAAGQTLRASQFSKLGSDVWSDGCFGYGAFPGTVNTAEVLFLLTTHRGLPGRSSLTILDAHTNAVISRSHFAA
jgi:hypothetical protein